VRDGWPLKEICFETLKLDADDVPLGCTTTIYISNTKLPRSDDLRPSGTLARPQSALLLPQGDRLQRDRQHTQDPARRIGWKFGDVEPARPTNFRSTWLWSWLKLKFAWPNILLRLALSLAIA